MKTNLPLEPNTLYHGDCMDIMQPWAKQYPNGCVDLIYLDPPFNSNANYNVLYGKDQKGKPRTEQAQFIAFHDTWYWGAEAAERVRNISRAVGHPAYNAMRGLIEMLPESGMLAYLSYMAERLAVMRTLLKETGGIYLHCDPTASHYLKTILDCVFGSDNFINEVIWYYKNASRGKKTMAKSHDVIFWYAKSNKYTFRREQVLQPYESGMTAWRHRQAGKKPPKGKTPDDVITMASLNTMDNERLGYPTQKPLALLTFIVQASSKKGDLVLDPFCGCGTTMEAAWNLKREFIGIDISPYAITRVCRDRLKNATGVSVRGLPTDMQSARDLLNTKDGAFVFEHWAVSLLEGYAPNDKQTGDGGIDGRGRLLNPPVNEDGEHEKGLCVAQVKGGKVNADALRAFLSQIAGGAFSMGVFITLEKQKMTPTMREVIGKAGKLQPQGEAKSYDRIVFWSIEEYFNGIEAKLPGMTHPFTGRALHAQIPAG